MQVPSTHKADRLYEVPEPPFEGLVSSRIPLRVGAAMVFMVQKKILSGLSIPRGCGVAIVVMARDVGANGFELSC